MKTALPTILAASLMLTVSGAAFAQTGPVARACRVEIATMCAHRPHNGSVRACLERRYHRLSRHCRVALDRTGGGRHQWRRPRD